VRSLRNTVLQTPERRDVRVPVEEEWCCKQAKVLFGNFLLHHVLHDRISKRRMHDGCRTHLQNFWQCAQPTATLCRKDVTRPELRGARTFIEGLNDVVAKCSKIVVPHHPCCTNALQLCNHFIR
jgi:hypothetical protein